VANSGTSPPTEAYLLGCFLTLGKSCDKAVSLPNLAILEVYKSAGLFGEETAQGNAEGGGVTVGEAEARLRRKRVEFIFDRDANSIHL